MGKNGNLFQSRAAGPFVVKKDRILDEYTLRDIHKPIGIFDYELTRALPESLLKNLKPAYLK